MHDREITELTSRLERANWRLIGLRRTAGVYVAYGQDESGNKVDANGPGPEMALAKLVRFVEAAGYISPEQRKFQYGDQVQLTGEALKWWRQNRPEQMPYGTVIGYTEGLGYDVKIVGTEKQLVGNYFDEHELVPAPPAVDPNEPDTPADVENLVRNAGRRGSNRDIYKNKPFWVAVRYADEHSFQILRPQPGFDSEEEATEWTEQYPFDSNNVEVAVVPFKNIAAPDNVYVPRTLTPDVPPFDLSAWKQISDSPEQIDTLMRNAGWREITAVSDDLRRRIRERNDLRNFEHQMPEEGNEPPLTTGDRVKVLLDPKTYPGGKVNLGNVPNPVVINSGDGGIVTAVEFTERLKPWQTTNPSYFAPGASGAEPTGDEMAQRPEAKQPEELERLRMKQWLVTVQMDDGQTAKSTADWFVPAAPDNAETLLRNAGWKVSEYHLDGDGPYGYTNWETSSAALMIDDTQETHNESRRLVREGATPEQFAEWATKAILAPYNRQQIADAQEWNEIPEHDRIDHSYEDFKEKVGPELAEQWGNNDIADTSANVILDSKVNWYEIVETIRDSIEEDDNYDQPYTPPPNPDQPGDFTLPEHWSARIAAWVPAVGDKVMLRPEHVQNAGFKPKDPRWESDMLNYPEGVITEISYPPHRRPDGSMSSGLFKVEGPLISGLLVPPENLIPLETTQDSKSAPAVPDTLPEEWKLSSDYRMNHQVGDDNPSMDDAEGIEQVMPDFYERPELYNHNHNGSEFRQIVQIMKAARGNPDYPVTIYRGIAPIGERIPEHGSMINTGDWVTTSEDYARKHALHFENPEFDGPVLSATVPASTLRNEGYPEEWAYFGPPVASNNHVASISGWHTLATEQTIRRYLTTGKSSWMAKGGELWEFKNPFLSKNALGVPDGTPMYELYRNGERDGALRVDVVDKYVKWGELKPVPEVAKQTAGDEPPNDLGWGKLRHHVPVSDLPAFGQIPADLPRHQGKTASKVQYSPINMAYVSDKGTLPAGNLVWGSGGDTICSPCAAADQDEVAPFSRHEVQNLERNGRGHTRCDRCNQDMLSQHSHPPTPGEHQAQREGYRAALDGPSDLTLPEHWSSRQGAKVPGWHALSFEDESEQLFSELNFRRHASKLHSLAEKAREKILARPDLQKWMQDEAQMSVDFTRKWNDFMYKSLHPSQNPNTRMDEDDWKYRFENELEQVKDRTKDIFDNMPDEAFKAFPWVLRELKQKTKLENDASRVNFSDIHNDDGLGDQPWITNASHGDRQHFTDIAGQIGKTLYDLRLNNKPAPDINQMDFKTAEAWMMEERAKNLENGWEDPEHVYTFSDGWTVDAIKTEHDLAKEGDALGHCSGGYYPYVKDGSTTLYSLRDPKGGSHVTMELRPQLKGGGSSALPEDWHDGFDVVQVHGKGNSDPKPEYKAKVTEWFAHKMKEGEELSWDGSGQMDGGYGQDSVEIRDLRDLDEWWPNYVSSLDNDPEKGPYGLPVPQDGSDPYYDDAKILEEALETEIKGNNSNVGYSKLNISDLAKAVFTAEWKFEQSDPAKASEWMFEKLTDWSNETEDYSYDRSEAQDRLDKSHGDTHYLNHSLEYMVPHEDLAPAAQAYEEANGFEPDWSTSATTYDGPEDHGFDPNTADNRYYNDYEGEITEHHDAIRGEHEDYIYGDAWRLAAYVGWLAKLFPFQKGKEPPRPETMPDITDMPYESNHYGQTKPTPGNYWHEAQPVPGWETTQPEAKGIPGALASVGWTTASISSSEAQRKLSEALKSLSGRSNAQAKAFAKSAIEIDTSKEEVRKSLRSEPLDFRKKALEEFSAEKRKKLTPVVRRMLKRRAS